MSMCTRHLSDLNRPKAAGDLGPINPVSMHGVVALELEECVLRGALLFEKNTFALCWIKKIGGTSFHLDRLKTICPC
jgi:hypothetical protein